MSGYRNCVQLIGNLGADPEVRTFSNGGRVVTFPVATTESWKDRNSGERREKTEWHRCVVNSEALGLLAEKYLRKGSKVFLEGKLETRSYEDGEGITRYVTEVVLRPFNGTLTFLDRKPDGERGDGGEVQTGSKPAAKQGQRRTGGTRGGRKQRETVGAGGFGSGGDLDDTDIPF